MLAVLVAGFVVWAALIIHELGHFVACLLARIPVESFYLGLRGGPRLRFRVGGCSFQISPFFVFGGGVAAGQDLRQVSLGRRLMFSLGGPVANLLSAVMLVLTLSLGDGPWFYFVPAFAVMS